MKCNKHFITALLGISLCFAATFMHAAHAQISNNTDYGTLQDIVPIIATYKKSSPTLMVPIGYVPPISVPAVPNPTYPIPITTTPSAPGKYPLVRWLLPGGPPPPAPNLPPFPYTCVNVICLN
jgi:hypothetical protein